MYLTAEGLPSDKLKLLVQHFTSGTCGSELQSFFSEVLNSEEIWRIGCSLISTNASPQEQYFGLSLLKNAVRSSSAMPDEFAAPTHNAIFHIIDDCVRLNQVSHSSMLDSLLRKSFELLAHMLFRFEDFWKCPVNCMFDLVGFGKTGRFTYILLFLTVLLEEFGSTDLPFHKTRKVKQLILQSEPLVFDLFQNLMASQSDEQTLLQVMTCCSLWISALTLGSAALECTGLISLLYQTMSRSELLYLTGLDCLILLFESTGCGLSSSRPTVHLLDFHITNLAAFHGIMHGLRDAHATAVDRGLTWEEFDQRESLTKSTLLLHTFADKQASQLVVQILSTSEPASQIHHLLDMFLIPLSVRGHYPRDELVSDFGAQIWFSLLDALVTCRLEIQTESIGLKLLRDTQLRFLDAAFLKCHYPFDAHNFFVLWSPEEREEWYKSRSELGDTFMLAYSHKQSVCWFTDLYGNLSRMVDLCEMDTATWPWRELEAMLFVLHAIHDQVSHEVVHEDRSSFQCTLAIVQHSLQLISRLQPTLFRCPGGPAYEESATGHCLLSCTLFDILCGYPPILSSFQPTEMGEYPLHQWCGVMLNFALSSLTGSLNVMVNREVKISFLRSAIKFVQTFIQNFTGLEEHADSVVTALGMVEGIIKSEYPSLEPLLWHLFGLLMSCRSIASSIVPMMYSQVDGVRNLFQVHSNTGDDGVTGHSTMTDFNSTSQEQRFDATLDRSIQRLLKSFTQFFAGVTKALEQMEQGDAECRSPSDCWQTRADASGLLLLLIKTLSTAPNAIENDPKWIKMFTQLLQSGIRMCDPSSDRMGHTGEILDCSVPIVERILKDSKTADNIVFDLSWSLLDALLHNAKRQNEPNGLSTCLRLLNSCFHLIDSVIECIANDVITGLSSAPPADRTTASLMKHPISPFLLVSKAQEITEHLSSSAKLLYRIFDWPNTRRVHFTDVPCQLDLFCLFESKTGLPRGHCWTLSFTIVLAGLCTPEWLTVQPCIRLAQSMLTKLTASEHSELINVLITPDLLLQLHASLIMVFTKGALPRRLVANYACLYTTLNQIMPDKQFSLLHALIGVTEVPVTWVAQLLNQSPHNRYIRDIVTQAVQRSTVAQRGRFVHSVTRSATPLDLIKSAINDFSNACAGYVS